MQIAKDMSSCGVRPLNPRMDQAAMSDAQLCRVVLLHLSVLYFT